VPDRAEPASLPAPLAIWRSLPANISDG